MSYIYTPFTSIRQYKLQYQYTVRNRWGFQNLNTSPLLYLGRVIPDVRDIHPLISPLLNKPYISKSFCLQYM
jgi:hypothetical protein